MQVGDKETVTVFWKLPDEHAYKKLKYCCNTVASGCVTVREFKVSCRYQDPMDDTNTTVIPSQLLEVGQLYACDHVFSIVFTNIQSSEDLILCSVKITLPNESSDGPWKVIINKNLATDDICCSNSLSSMIQNH